MNSRSTASTVDLGSFCPHPPPPHLAAQLAPNRGAPPIRCPSPLLRDVGPPPPRSTDGYGREGTRGGTQKWEAQEVRRENETRILSCLVLVVLILPTPPAPSLLDTPTSGHPFHG